MNRFAIPRSTAVSLPCVFWLSWLLLAAGCVPQAAATSTATPTLSPQPSRPPPFPTALASATLTPPPSATPTPDISTGLGEVLFQDDFAQDRGWTLRSGQGGAVSLLPGRLVVAVHNPGAMLFSLSPAPAAADFYLEAELRTELCGQEDEFGLMVRVLPNLDYYLFSLTCDGQARVSRFVSGQEAALVPLAHTGAALPGAPAVNRLAVWAQGDQFRFLVNEVEVFSLREASLPSGGFGLAARSRRSPQVTVSLLSFSLRALQPAATPTG
jgi:hypothetical protein